MISKVGITEGGDAGLDFAWVDKLLEANIIISKNLNDRLIDAVLANQSKIILHITVTGLGGSVYEPNVPELTWTITQIRKLLAQGFPAEQCVLRIDPIIPNTLGLLALNDALSTTKDLGISRCRVSFLDQYPHVSTRLAIKGIRLPWSSFHAPDYYKDFALQILGRYKYAYEACAEPGIDSLGCISTKDLQILGHSTNITTKCPQRKECHCLNIKQELLGVKRQCPHKCIYCYWR